MLEEQRNVRYWKVRPGVDFSRVFAKPLNSQDNNYCCNSKDKKWWQGCNQCQVRVGVRGGPPPEGYGAFSQKLLNFEALGLHFGQFLANLAFSFCSFKKGICERF